MKNYFAAALIPPFAAATLVQMQEPENAFRGIRFFGSARVHSTQLTLNDLREASGRVLQGRSRNPIASGEFVRAAQVLTPRPSGWAEALEALSSFVCLTASAV